MFGQWIGQTTGTNKGFCVVNIEDRSPPEGTMMFFDMDPKKYSMWASVFLKIENGTIKGKLSNYLIFYENGLLKSEELNEKLKNDRYPVIGEISGLLLGKGLMKGSFKTNVNTQGEFALTKAVLGAPTPPDHEMNWSEYKAFINAINKTNKYLIYRGQYHADQRLQTSYHRTGRTDLLRYFSMDIPTLLNDINMFSEYKYNLYKEGDLDILLNIAQHHGFPTPFLDWTESPYIAAYFAYKKKEDEQEADKVRIFIFDTVPWVNLWSAIAQKSVLLAPKPIISIHKFPKLNNYRAMQQKAISVFSNIVDIEYFFDSSKEFGKLPTDFFQRINLPYSEKETVMEDLKKMDITEETLFPNLDHICSHLKSKCFP